MNICIIDYGLGNIFSIKRAISFLGHDAIITNEHIKIKSSDRIILPGVGTFGDCMKKLRIINLDQVLRECAKDNVPILGICLGMQLLFSNSEEFGIHQGLSLIPGSVKKFPPPSPTSVQYKIPHVGWSQVFTKNKCQELNIFNDVPQGALMYFAHSFYSVPESVEHVLANSEYAGIEFCCAVKNQNVIGVQFHPELSGNEGLKIYDEFLKN